MTFLKPASGRFLIFPRNAFFAKELIVLGIMGLTRGKLFVQSADLKRRTSRLCVFSVNARETQSSVIM